MAAQSAEGTIRRYAMTSSDRAADIGGPRITRQLRTIDDCIECFSHRAIVSRGLCAACYMRARREVDVDPHRTPHKQRMTRKKMRTAHAGMLHYAEDFGFSDADLSVLNDLIRPYMRPIEETVPDPDRSAIEESVSDPDATVDADRELTS